MANINALPHVDQARLREIIRSEGLAATSRRLGMTRHAVASLAGGLPVREATMRLGAERLSALGGVGPTLAA